MHISKGYKFHKNEELILRHTNHRTVDIRNTFLYILPV